MRFKLTYPRSRVKPWVWRMVLGLIFLAALLAGFYFQPQLARVGKQLLPSPSSGRKVLYWTSPHAPSIRSDKPGKTAMGMDLVPVYADRASTEPGVIDPALVERDVATTIVQSEPRMRTIATVGTIAYAEPRIADVTLKIDAWIEKLHVDYLGQPVHRGDKLFEIYSPKLVSTQEEVVISAAVVAEARKKGITRAMKVDQDNLESARQRLRYWDVTDKQIEALAAAGKVPKTLTFFSPADGIVTEKTAVEGSFVKAGELLYRIADLSVVWADLYIYPNQIQSVYEHQQATLTLPNLPGHTFQGKVVYIYPYLQSQNRTVKVRLEVPNPDLLLKPGMFAQVKLEPDRMGEGVNVLRQAVMHTGRRDLVYLALPRNEFEAREVTLGTELDGGMVAVLSGLRGGERVVMSPEFLMDSESRLRSVNLRFEPLPALEKKLMNHEMQNATGLPRGASR